jgi:hypothetical protein
MDGLVSPKVIPKGVGMIRVEIDQIAGPINGTGIEKALNNLRSIVGVWAANAVTNISILGQANLLGRNITTKMPLGEVQKRMS